THWQPENCQAPSSSPPPAHANANAKRSWLEQAGRGLFKGWVNVNQASTIGLWNTITTTYDVYHDNIAAATDGEQSWGSTALNIWAYNEQASAQTVTGPFTDLADQSKAVATDASHGDWEGATEHA